MGWLGFSVEGFGSGVLGFHHTPVTCELGSGSVDC